MKARTVKWIDTRTRQLMYGIEITKQGEKFFGSDDNGPMLSTDKKVISNKVREFNRKHRFV
jgi:hypothetical protein